jgi:glycosyltransferase involved in cell wall biosynthesis
MAPMTIAYDVTSTITGATGVARYVRELGAALRELPDGAELRPFAVGRRVVAGGVDAARVRTPLRLVARSWAHGGPPSIRRLVGPHDSVHAAGPALPTSSAPVVAVVHDLAALDHPDLHPARDVAQLRRYVAHLDRAAAVVTGSQATARRLADLAPRATVHVTPYGRPPLAVPEPPPLAGRPYVLAVGAPVPRKRYDLLLRAVARSTPPDTAVALVGPTGTEDRTLEQLVAELGLRERYRRAVDVTDAQLAGWYAGASVMAAPSVEEGFGFPLLEAQGLGVPVVASDIPVHREVAGDAAWFVPVDDAAALGDALALTLAGGAAVDAQALTGPANAVRYTWDACAAATLAVHRAVVAS